MNDIEYDDNANENNVDDKKEQVAFALLDLTERGRLTWTEVAPDDEALPPALSAADEPVFASTYQGMDLFLNRPEDAPEDDAPGVALRVADPDTGASVSFPSLAVLEDLYERVWFRASGIDEWMDDVLETVPVESDETGSAGDDADGEEAQVTEKAPDEDAAAQEDAEEEPENASAEGEEGSETSNAEASQDGSGAEEADGSPLQGEEESKESGTGVFEAGEGGFNDEEEMEDGIL